MSHFLLNRQDDRADPLYALRDDASTKKAESSHRYPAGTLRLSDISWQSFIAYLGGPVLYACAFLMLRAVIYFIVERREAAHTVPYRSVWWRDTLAWTVFTFMIVPVAQGVHALLGLHLMVPDSVLALPLGARLVAYIVLADFIHYWIHRFMHTQKLWRIHRWHHSPTYMYWLAGARGSLPQQMVVGLPYFSLGTLIGIAPPWLVLVGAIWRAVENDWMHLNVPWGNRWVEWVLVTPRYHHIHHSDNPAHYRSNLGVMFSIWDRLFGTYMDPERIQRPLSFGIGETVPVVRLALGV
jgi:sterol desaturase/sphingolipid hydroxylase (fatty acid hydroxylase superfamily)